MILPAVNPTLALNVRKVFRAPPEQVFRAWTEVDELKHWFAAAQGYTIPVTELDLRVGGRYRFGMKGPERTEASVATGVYEEITPPSRLVFTWRWEDAGPEYPTTRVTVEFWPHAEGTELVLTHEGFAEATERDQHGRGWQGCLDSLERLIMIEER
jgi:uncharacterized protein YndB with AHSA1/START domain